jgi:hypothetical protein
MTAPLRTLSELVSDIATAMADWPDIDNGQIRSVPDERTLRYYATLGLMDRPLSWRGRTALYGTRHRWQVLAVKRLQAAQWPLTAIQGYLLNADDAVLRAAVANPGTPPDVQPAGPETELSAERTAKDAAGSAAPAPTATAPVTQTAPGPAQVVDATPSNSLSASTAAPASSASPVAEASRPRRSSAFWSAPAIPASETRVHVDCNGAAVILPAGLTADAELAAALAPLTAWVNARLAVTATPVITASSPGSSPPLTSPSTTGTAQPPTGSTPSTSSPPTPTTNPANDRNLQPPTSSTPASSTASSPISTTSTNDRNIP